MGELREAAQPLVQSSRVDEEHLDARHNKGSRHEDDVKPWPFSAARQVHGDDHHAQAQDVAEEDGQARPHLVAEMHDYLLSLDDIS